MPEGPGINDNGSGSAAVLEAALRLARAPAQARGRVRFAFWGAEERGLVGSRHHVGALSEAERRDIAVYINLDMVGSPNFVRFVQGSAAVGDGAAGIARANSSRIFASTALLSRSAAEAGIGTDDAAFSQKGIPTVGLYTGRRRAEVGGRRPSSFGGAAGRPYDPCYHQACDTVENINREVLEENTRALVRVLNAVAIAPAPGTPARKAEETPEPSP